MARRDEGSASDSVSQFESINIQSVNIPPLKSDGNINCSDETRIWLSCLMKENERRRSTPRSQKIQRVPPIFRNVEGHEKCYEPLVVSIGPYHHGKSGLELMEKQKRKMACDYANDDPETLESLYTKVKDVAQSARDCYQDDDKKTLTNLTNDGFTRMMFLDGCFVLQFIYDFVGEGNYKNLEMTQKTAALVKRDLLLLENQIPFLVVMQLISFKFDSGYKIENFFTNFIGTFGVKYESLFLNPYSKIEKSSHLLQCTRELLIIGGNNGIINPSEGGRRSTYGSAKELKAMGIHCRPRIPKHRDVIRRGIFMDYHKFTDVYFRCGIFRDYLYLPPIAVDDFTKSLLLNMVVYESCAGNSDGLSITSYFCFLNSLIGDAEDVKELRSSRILNSCLGSDQQVADLFNQIAENLVPDPSAYADVKSKIEKHCQCKRKVWFADFWNTYFASPWTFLALVGAIFALILTVIQTYKAMYPPSPTDTKAPSKPQF